MRIKTLLLVMVIGGMLTLASFTSYTLYSRGDVNQDGSVNISDVTCLIDYLLSECESWDGDESAPETETFTVNGVSFKMVAVKGGMFTMGTIDNQYTVETPHQVILSDYRIGETEVTQELWLAVMGSNPSEFSAANGYDEDLKRPVESISWSNAKRFITKLNQLTGREFRLPSEAQWEFAARGGCMSQGFQFAGSDNYLDVAWCATNSGMMTHAVATKIPNELGLYDMTGNVWEWCEDTPYGYFPATQIDPCPVNDIGQHTKRILRGGSWKESEDDYHWLSVLHRNQYNYQDDYKYFGLRLAM